MVHYCEKNKVISSNQAGFRKGTSTIDHLVQLRTQIKRQFARRKKHSGNILWCQKSIWSSVALEISVQAKFVGISGQLCNYIKNHLSNRTIQTKVGNTYSNPRTLQMGIPQGSVIAPILLLTFWYKIFRNRCRRMLY